MWFDIQRCRCTPLVWAVHNNHYENAKILLEAGADVNVEDSQALLCGFVFNPNNC